MLIILTKNNMFNRFEWKVGVRYLKAGKKSSFVSFISLVSVIGITLGVMALIVVLSVMNGFQKEIRNKLIGVSAHIQVTDISKGLSNWELIGNIAKKNKLILSFAPYIDGQALASFDGNVTGIIVRGVLPEYEKQVDEIANKVIKGRFNSLVANQFNMVIGKELANILDVNVGDKLTIVTPDGQVTPAGLIPRIKQFKISAIFDSGMYEYDSSLVFINLEDAKALFKTLNNVSGVRLKVNDVMQTEEIKEQLERQFPKNILVNDWISLHQNYFSAVKLEKRMMFIVLLLIVAVATFNLVSTLVMTVNEKKADIAILRTMGASKSSIMKIFIIQGAIAGIVGTCMGTILGLLVAKNISKIVGFFEYLFNTKLISEEIYNINFLPSQVVFSDVAFVFLISLLLSIVATIYPSYNASNLDPVEILRYE